MCKPMDSQAKAIPRHGESLCATREAPHFLRIYALTTHTQLTVIVFTVLHPTALVASIIWGWFRGRTRRTGPIALPPDEETAPNGAPHGERPAREVDAEAIWG